MAKFKKSKKTRRKIGNITIETETTIESETKGSQQHGPSRYSDFNPFKAVADAMNDRIKGNKRAFLQGEFTLFTFISDLGSEFTEENVRARKFRGFGGRFISLDEYKAGYDTVLAIVKNKELQVNFITKAYDRTVRPVLVKRLGTRTLRRGGFKQVVEDDDSDSKKKPFKPASLRPENELGEKWKTVHDIISGPIKLQTSSSGALGFYPFTMQDLLGVNVSSQRSTRSNVYMMAEFGTGDVAKPGPRRYTSRSKTPFKLPPIVAAGIGGTTAQWVSRYGLLNRSGPKNPLGIIPGLLERISTLRGDLAGSRRGAKLFGEKLSPKELKEHRESIRNSIERSLRTLDKINAAQVFGSPGAKSIKPRHVIFNERGVVAEVQQAYKNFIKLYIKLLNDYTYEKVSFWPKNGWTIENQDLEIFSFDTFKNMLS